LIPLYSVKHPVGRLDVDRLRADAEVITLPPFAAGELPEAVITEAGLSISPIRRVVSEEAELLARRLYAMLPRVRITELLAEVHAWTGFAHRFTHLRNGQTAADLVALMSAVLADGTNLGLSRMAESAHGLTHARLLWTAEWHIRDETYAAALAVLVHSGCAGSAFFFFSRTAKLTGR